ncbi:bifunctional diguanylate cyclase/phosphodiesterase [Paenibacillus koleovorans]|uniref:bifunctional diguanylate cyclase/phosphodiesterase n=1 Tax=Paenibacillus koleovorans TaxID=121608 RepID=UPI000FD72453|nr:EAL domain-containing protein [Paenibacillus koleovorans]
MDYSVLSGHYNFYLMFLSFMIAIMASFTALDLARRVTLTDGWRRKLWLTSGAVSMGIGIWAMHFIAMLSFHLTSVKAAYNMVMVGISILVAVLASLGGLFTSSRSRLTLTRLLLGGILMGFAISGMHYIGMAAMEGVAIRYSPGLFVLSFVIAIASSMLALLLAFRLRGNVPLFMHVKKVGSGIIMGFGISGMHYTGMAAAHFTPIPLENTMSSFTVDPFFLAICVAVGSGVILKIVLFTSYFADKRLAEQMAFNGSILEKAIDCIVLTDREGKVTEFNPAAELTFGYERMEMMGQPLIKLIVLPPFLANRSVVEFLELTSSGAIDNRIETQAVHADGYEITVELTVTQVSLHGMTQYTIYMRDITDRKLVEGALKESEERYRRLVDFSPEAIVVHRNGKIVFANEATVRMLGVPDTTFLFGHSVYDWVGEDRKEEVTAWLHAIEYAEDPAGPIELEIMKYDGERIEIEANSILIQIEGKSFIQTIARDITEKKRSERTVKQMAYYDGLTGLPNRNKFNDLVTHSLEFAFTHELLVAIMFIDVDRFKHINDTLGHPVGDLLLKELAKRLSRCVRDSDTASRLGGDEFIVLLPNTTRDQAAIVAKRMMDAIAKPFAIEGNSIVVTTSIGIAMYPNDGETSEALIKNADLAMYEAKELGKNSFRFYNQRMNMTAARKLALEQGLRGGLERGEFILHYQPKMSLSTEQIVGVEALIRWEHPELGTVGPVEFIPLAEQSGLIVPMGEWTLRTACRQNQAWQLKGYPPMRVAVNLSMLQFKQDDLVDKLKLILQDTGMSPEYLELEITESVAMNNQEQVIEKLQAIKQLGIQISIDDFGTGYSSLSYLNKYPFDTIKIDRSFIRDMREVTSEAAIVQSIIEMAHSLKMNVLAEGVETAEQVAILKAHKCDEMQGFYMCRPLSASSFEAKMLAGKPGG